MIWRRTQYSDGKLLREVSGSGMRKGKAQFDTFSCLEIRKFYRIKLWAGQIMWSGFSGRTRAALSASRDTNVNFLKC